ncbi:MAG: hypothetical protein H6642_04875 [Caldilineaceae bacterium]|nr:hypothetical protein [Caldilineaceae bacterium]
MRSSIQRPGQPAYRSPGDVTGTDATLELSCLSRERLAAMRQIEMRQIEMLARQAEQWLDTPLIDLDDQTPREASPSAEGRAKLEDALKIIEYLEEENPALQGTPGVWLIPISRST